MSIKVFVKDRNDRPAARVPVRVMWQSGGPSSGRTDANGVFDTGVNSNSMVRDLYVDDIRRAEGGGVRVNGDHVFNIKINRSV